MSVSFVGVSSDPEFLTPGDEIVSLAPHASTSEGDRMVAFCGAVGSSWTAGSPQWSASGWTELVNEYETGGADRVLTVLTKVAGASEGASSFSTNETTNNLNGIVAIVTLSGADESTALDEAYVSADHFSVVQDQINLTPDPIDVNTANAAVLIAQYHSSAHNEVTDFGVSSGYTEALDVRDGFGRNLFIQYKTGLSAGTETPGNTTHTGSATSNDISSVTLAIKPVVTKDGRVVLLRRRRL